MRLYVLLLMASSVLGSSTVVYVRLDTTNQSLVALPANLINQCTKGCEKTVGCSGFSILSLQCSLLSLPLPSAPSSISFVRTTSALSATCPSGSKHFATFGPSLPSGPQSVSSLAPSSSSSGGQTSASTASSLSQSTGVTHEAARQTSVASTLVGSITTIHSNEGETSANGRTTMKSGASGTSELSTATTTTRNPTSTSVSTSTAIPSSTATTSSTNHQPGSVSTSNHASSSTSTGTSLAISTMSAETVAASLSSTPSSSNTSTDKGGTSSPASSTSPSSAATTLWSTTTTSTAPIPTSTSVPTSTVTSTVTSQPATSPSSISTATSSMASSASPSTTSTISTVISTSNSTSTSSRTTTTTEPSTTSTSTSSTTTTPLTTLSSSASSWTTAPATSTSTASSSTTSTATTSMSTLTVPWTTSSSSPSSSTTTLPSSTTTTEPTMTSKSTSTSTTTTTPSTTSSTSTTTTTTALPTTTEYNILSKFKFVDVPGSNVSCYYETRTKGRFSTNGLCALEGSDPCKTQGLVSVFLSCAGKKALTVVPDWQCASTLSYKNSLCVPWEAMFADKANPTENGMFSNIPGCASGTGLVDGGGYCTPNPYGVKMLTGRYKCDNLLTFRKSDDEGLMISTRTQLSWCPVKPDYFPPNCKQIGTSPTSNIGWTQTGKSECELPNYYKDRNYGGCGYHSVRVFGSGGERCIGWDKGSTTTPFSKSLITVSKWFVWDGTQGNYDTVLGAPLTYKDYMVLPRVLITPL